MKCNKCGMETGDATAHTCPTIPTYPPLPERRPWKGPGGCGTGKGCPTGSATMLDELPCHACNGTGVVWG